jgi:predicted Zn-dependent peptidase
MKVVLPLFLFIVLLGQASASQEVPVRAIAPSVIERRLPNGARAFISHYAGPSAKTQIVIGTGATRSSELPGEQGAALVMSRIIRARIADELARAGADYAVETLSVTSEPRNLVLSIDVLDLDIGSIGSIIAAALSTQSSDEEFHRAQKTVLAQLASAASNSEARAVSVLRRRLFLKSVALESLVNIDAITRLTAAAVQKYAAREVTPSRFTIAVVGALSDSALEAVVKPIGAMSNSRIGSQHAKEPRSDGQGRVEGVDVPGATVATIAIGCTVPGLLDPSRSSAEIAASVIAGTSASPLARALRERAHVLYSVRGSITDISSDISYWSVILTVNAGDVKAVIAAVSTLAPSVSDSTPSPDDIAIARESVLRTAARPWETHSRLAQVIGFLVSRSVPLSSYDAAVAASSGSSEHEIRARLSDVFNVERMSAVVVGDQRAIGPLPGKLGRGGL